MNRLLPRFCDPVIQGGFIMVERVGALGYFGDARRAATGTELIERVSASGSLVIRKLGVRRAGELAIHRFLSAPSVTCQEVELRTEIAGPSIADRRIRWLDPNRPGYGVGGRPIKFGIPAA